MTTVLVVAAHPDDEVLGCGATLARHIHEGDTVHVLIVADGESARGHTSGLASRNRAAHNAASTLGTKPPRLLGLPDNRLDRVALLDIVLPLEQTISELLPQVIYTHHGGDLNIDHALTHRAVMTACRPLPQNSVAAVYTFEVPSSTEWSPAEAFVPNYFVNVSAFFDAKMAALRCYSSEMRPSPHPRSYEAAMALAQWRGATCGFKLAEAFSAARQLRF